MKLFDVIIVGGGPAGLSAALGLVRAHRSVLLIDSKHYRNSKAPAMQNVLAFDGVAPSVFREKARLDLERYPTFSSIEGSATRVTQREDLTLLHSPTHKLQLDVQLGNTSATQVASQKEESFLARRLVFACGVMDVLPAIPGAEEAWGDTMHMSAHTSATCTVLTQFGLCSRLSCLLFVCSCRCPALQLSIL